MREHGRTGRRVDEADGTATHRGLHVHLIDVVAEKDEPPVGEAAPHPPRRLFGLGVPAWTGSKAEKDDHGTRRRHRPPRQLVDIADLEDRHLGKFATHPRSQARTDRTPRIDDDQRDLGSLVGPQAVGSVGRTRGAVGILGLQEHVVLPAGVHFLERQASTGWATIKDILRSNSIIFYLLLVDLTF